MNRVTEMRELKGIIPALVTPFTSDNTLDEDGLRWLCRNSIENGVHGIIVAGSLGEFPNLTDAERRRAVEVVVNEVDGRVPVLAGVGSPSTKRALDLVEESSKLGADFALVLPPFYYSATEETVLKHYQTIAKSATIPLILYNFPDTTKVNMSPQLVARLAELEAVMGIKNSVDSLIHLRELVRLTKNVGKSFAVLAGMEDYLIAGLLLGAKGTVSGLSNFIPQVLVEIYNKMMEGKVKEASAIYNDMIVPLKALAPPPEPIGALKVGVKLVSQKTTALVREPLHAAPGETEAGMKAFLLGARLLPTRITA
jgi:4-hydroxy-tetrahydrodipicolinate synthase